MDRSSIVIERQEQIEELIREWGFLPFFKDRLLGRHTSLRQGLCARSRPCFGGVKV